MKIKFILIIILLTGCGSFNEAGKALRNEKIKTTDEFLVQKKGPLVLPPDYKEIPAPETMIKKDENPKNKIKKILKAPKINSKPGTKSLEKSIIEKITK